MSRKAIIKLGNTTNVSGETMTAADGSTLTQAYSEFAHMNVVIKLTITGTNPTFTVAVQENFGGTWVQTAKSKALTATGNYMLVQGMTPPDQTSVLNNGAFWGLGSGADKRVVTTVGGTQVVLDADIYFVFFD